MIINNSNKLRWLIPSNAFIRSLWELSQIQNGSPVLAFLNRREQNGGLALCQLIYNGIPDDNGYCPINPTYYNNVKNPTVLIKNGLGTQEIYLPIIAYKKYDKDNKVIEVCHPVAPNNLVKMSDDPTVRLNIVPVVQPWNWVDQK